MPAQCPECGRFLAKAFVAGLGTEPTPCPRCESPLTAAMLQDDVAAARTSDAAAQTSEVAPDPDASVRPPDLAPDTVREDDVLDGWDRGADVVDLARFRDDQPPFPVDAAIVGGGLLAGAILGAMVGQRRVRGAALGAVVGTLVAATARRVWRLE